MEEKVHKEKERLSVKELIDRNNKQNEKTRRLLKIIPDLELRGLLPTDQY